MDNDKLLFKCPETKSLKNLNEANKIIFKKRIYIIKIILSLILILFLVFYALYLMYNEDLFLTDAINYVFSSKIIIFIYILMTIYIWKLIEIQNWITIKTRRIKIENIEKTTPTIDFYETFYENSFYLNSSSIVRVNYSDLTKFFITKNLYILCVFQSKTLVKVTIIRKDSFIEGNEQEFVKFIQSKVSIQ
ncbi:MAG: hypothetical protein ACERKV_04125 [Clostridiaceae bacterium]